MKAAIKALSALLFLFYLSPLQAFTCYEESQDLIKLGDAYYDIDNPVELTNKTRKKLNSLYRTLTGEWAGRIEEVDCRGTDNSPRQEVKTYAATTRISAGTRESLKLRFEKFSKHEGITRNELLELVSKDILFKIKATRKSTRLQEKYRISYGHYEEEDDDDDDDDDDDQKKPDDPKKPEKSEDEEKEFNIDGSAFYERLVDLQMSRNTLTINIRYYVNGHAASEQRIRLKKS